MGYRVAPTLEYRPFANAEEFKPCRDKWMMHKDKMTEKLHRVSNYNNAFVTLSSNQVGYDDLWYYYEFEDGTPCGVKV